MTTPPFPGAIGVSHLRVYDTEAPDGLRGGTPHLHTVCTEAYAVIGGRGAVQTLTVEGFRETPVEAGSFVWFTPGTVHRLVNVDGALEILVLMQNAGLPEAGDLVVTLPAEVLDDPPAYQALAVLPAGAQTTSDPDRAARDRRDLAVEGFAVLRGALDAGDPGPLLRLYDQAARLVSARTEDWRARWDRTARAAAEATGRQLDALAAGDPAHLRDAQVHALPPPGDERRYGCCGTLGTFVV